MIVGIHQPNYFPGISYFCKILYSDIFIFLDSVQFSKGNWTNRNRIKTAQGELMLTVPILTKGKINQKVCEVLINPREQWLKKHIRGIEQSYKKAPFFPEIMPILEGLLDNHWQGLAKMNIALIKKICDVLGMQKSFFLSSDLGGDNFHSTDLLISLIKTVGGNSYLSGAGGKKYMEIEKFPENGLGLHFLDYRPVPYRQQFGEFIPNLSIIDLLFNEGPDALRLIRESAEIA